MPTVVTNVGMLERDANGRRTTNINKTEGSEGTVTVEYENIQYVFAPGQSKTFSDIGIAAAVVAADARLRLADTREGNRTNGRT